MIGLKISYYSLIHLPSCYRTVCLWITKGEVKMAGYWSNIFFLGLYEDMEPRNTKTRNTKLRKPETQEK